MQRIQGLDALGYAATSAIFTAASALLLAVSGAVVMLVLNPALAGMVLLALAAAGIPPRGCFIGRCGRGRATWKRRCTCRRRR